MITAIIIHNPPQNHAPKPHKSQVYPRDASLIRTIPHAGIYAGISQTALPFFPHSELQLGVPISETYVKYVVGVYKSVN